MRLIVDTNEAQVELMLLMKQSHSFVPMSSSENIQSSAHKLLICLTLYINVALKRLLGCRTLAEGTMAIINLGLEDVPVPGESGFPFPGLFALPQTPNEAGTA